MADLIVVGGGQCGMLAARDLAADHRVTLVERLPAAGGQEPEHPETDLLDAACRRAGVTMTLGTLAVRYTNSSVEILGVDGAASLPCRALVIATGTRPATRGEMGIAGDRSAGVLPGSAAVHLTESGVLLGRRPVVIGNGQLAARCVEVLLEAGAAGVTLVAEQPLTCAPPSDASVLTGWRATSIHGMPRVSWVQIERDGEHARVQADAVILADRRLPMRNVEGAVLPRRGIVFCHSESDPKHVDDAMRCAGTAARAVGALLAEDPSGSAETSGHPEEE